MTCSFSFRVDLGGSGESEASRSPESEASRSFFPRILSAYPTDSASSRPTRFLFRKRGRGSTSLRVRRNGGRGTDGVGTLRNPPLTRTDSSGRLRTHRRRPTVTPRRASPPPLGPTERRPPCPRSAYARPAEAAPVSAGSATRAIATETVASDPPRAETRRTRARCRRRSRRTKTWQTCHLLSTESSNRFRLAGRSHQRSRRLNPRRGVEFRVATRNSSARGSASFVEEGPRTRVARVPARGRTRPRPSRRPAGGTG